MLTLRGLTLTAAAPRIIVPLFARSLDALRPLAAAAQADPAAELVELRLDPLPAADHTAALALVRSLTDKPLIVTIRTRAEGGELALTPDAYAACCALCWPAAAWMCWTLSGAPAAPTAMPCAALPAPPVPPRFSASITLTAPPPLRR